MTKASWPFSVNGKALRLTEPLLLEYRSIWDRYGNRLRYRY